MKLRPVIGKTLALALVALLLGMCLAEVVHAAMPDGAPMDCTTRLCNGPNGCAPTTTAVHHVLPVAIVPASPTLDAPSTPVWVAFVAQPFPPSRHRFLSSAPRSPPLA